jgi:hypothetical protein
VLVVDNSVAIDATVVVIVVSSTRSVASEEIGSFIKNVDTILSVSILAAGIIKSVVVSIEDLAMPGVVVVSIVEVSSESVTSGLEGSVVVDWISNETSVSAGTSVMGSTNSSGSVVVTVVVEVVSVVDDAIVVVVVSSANAIIIVLVSSSKIGVVLDSFVIKMADRVVVDSVVVSTSTAALVEAASVVDSTTKVVDMIRSVVVIGSAVVISSVVEICSVLVAVVMVDKGSVTIVVSSSVEIAARVVVSTVVESVEVSVVEPIVSNIIETRDGSIAGVELLEIVDVTSIEIGRVTFVSARFRSRSTAAVEVSVTISVVVIVVVIEGRVEEIVVLSTAPAVVNDTRRSANVVVMIVLVTEGGIVEFRMIAVSKVDVVFKSVDCSATVEFDNCNGMELLIISGSVVF